MSRILFAINHEPTKCLIKDVFRTLPVQERSGMESSIAAVTDDDLPTAVRPFMFGGKVIHELYFDPAKLLFFVRREKVGAVVSAFTISSLANESEPRIGEEIPLSDQA